MKNLSVIHPQVVPDLYEFVSPAEQVILKNVGNQTVDWTH